MMLGGGGEIRTHDGLAPTPVFKTGAFNHSATPPKAGKDTGLPSCRLEGFRAGPQAARGKW